MTQSLGEAVITVGADTSGLPGEVEKGTKSAFGPAGTKGGKTFGQKAVGSIGGVMKKGVKAAGVAGAATLGTALFKGFNRLKDIENAEASLRGLGHSAGSVEKIMGNALTSVEGTAFGLGDAAKVAATVVASGVKPGKDLTRTLKLVGDTATIAGTGMDEMGSIFNQVSATGKVTGETLAQLGGRGIPVLQLLADELGKTPAEVSKMASEGKIGFEEFQNAMEAGLGGAALEAGGTFQGAMANVGAALGRVGASLLSGIFPKMAPMFIKIQGALNEVQPAAEKLGKALGEGLAVAFDVLGVAITTSIDIIKSVAGFVGDNEKAFKISAGIITTLLIPAIVAWGVQAVITEAKVLGAWLSTKIAAVTSGAQQVLWNTFVAIGWVKTGVQAVVGAAKVVGAWVMTQASAAAGAAAQVGSLLLVRLGWVKSGAQATLAALKVVGAWVLTQASAVAGAAVQVGALLLVGLGWVKLGIQATLGAIRVAAAWLIALGPIGIVIAAVIGLVALIVLNWDKIKAVMAKVWNAIKVATAKVWQAILSSISKAINKVKSIIGWFGSLGSKFSSWFGKAKTAAVGKMVELSRYISGLPGRITRGLGDLGGLLVGKGKDIVRGLISGIGSMASSVGRALVNLLPGPLKKFAHKLGIESPSTVFAGFGKNIGQGLIVGVDSMRRAATESAARLADAMLGTPQIAGVGAAPGRSSRSLGAVNLPRTAQPATTAPPVSPQPGGGGITNNFGGVYQQPGESTDQLAARLWFKQRARG